MLSPHLPLVASTMVVYLSSALLPTRILSSIPRLLLPRKRRALAPAFENEEYEQQHEQQQHEQQRVIVAALLGAVLGLLSAFDNIFLHDR